MQVSPLREIAKDLPFFKTVDDREMLLGVVGALVLRRISLSKASEIMGMERERDSLDCWMPRGWSICISRIKM